MTSSTKPEVLKLIARFRQEQIEGLLLATCTENVVKFRHAIFDDDDDDDDDNNNSNKYKYKYNEICNIQHMRADRHTERQTYRH